MFALVLAADSAESRRWLRSAGRNGYRPTRSHRRASPRPCPYSAALCALCGQALVAQGRAAGIDKHIVKLGKDVAGLQELLLYGLKGLAAYADHARVLGRESEKVYSFVHEALDLLAADVSNTDVLVGACLRCGAVNLEVMRYRAPFIATGRQVA